MVSIIHYLNSKKTIKLLVILICISNCLFVFAESLELAPIIVTDDNNDPTFTVYDFVGSHSSIELEQSQFLEVEDILNQQAGIDIQSVSGIGQYATPIIRGAEGQQVLVFNNGIPLNNLNGSGADIGSISLIGINKIDIYRGMVPMELSPTAIGGAINFISKEIDSNEGYGGFTIGTYGVRQSFISQNISKEKLKIQFNIDHLKADNNFIYEEDQSVSSPSSLINEARHNNGSRNQQASSFINYQINNRNKFTAYIKVEDNKRELSDIINTPNNNSSIATKTRSASLNHQLTLEGSSTITTNYSLNDSSQIYDDREDKIGISSQHNQYDSLFNKLNITYKKKLDSVNLILNQQAQHETLKSYYLNDEKSSTDQCTETGILGQCDGVFNRIQLSSGIRSEWNITKSVYSNVQVVHLTNQDDAFSNESKKSNKSFTSLVSGISYRLQNGSIFTTNLSKQIRPPSTSELYGDRGTTIGNSNLIAEKSKAFEIGFQYPYQTYDFSLYYFYREVKDNITAQQFSNGIIQYSNIAQTHYQGLDLNLILDISPNLQFIGNATYQKGKIDDHINASVINNEIGDHRSVFINSSLTYSPSWWSVNLDYLLEDGGYYDDQNLLPRNRNSYWSISTSAKFNETTMSFSAINITDQRVRDFPDTPVSGRTFFFKLKQNWKI